MEISNVYANHLPKNLLADTLIRLPKDLLLGILNRLPLSSLIKLKPLSKSWSSLLQDQNFIKDFYRSQNTPLRLVSVTLNDSKLRFYSTSTDKDGVTRTRRTHICKSLEVSQDADMKFCNGLVLVDNKVCNPMTEEIRELPPRKDFHLGTNFSFEFGFDPQSKKYKVLAWDILCNDHCYMVCTVGTSLWRPVKNRPIERFAQNKTSSFSMNGRLYWCSKEETIVFFDLFQEEFGMIQGPKSLVSDIHDARIKYLFEFEGCLCIADHGFNTRNVAHPRTVDLWMQKDGNSNVWVKLMTISLPSKWVSSEIPFVTRKGEIVIAQSTRGTKIVYLCNVLSQKYSEVVMNLPLGYLVPNYSENLFREPNLECTLNSQTPSNKH